MSRNNLIGNIKMQTASYPLTKLDLTSDINTTCGWSETQPLCVREILADSKSVADLESLVRVKPLVKPTFGRVKYKAWHSFVPTADIYRNNPARLAKTPVSYGASTFTPTKKPWLRLSDLSPVVLIGAQVSVHIGGTSDDFDGDLNHALWFMLKTPVTSDSSSDSQVGWNDFVSDFGSAFSSNRHLPVFDDYEGPAIDISAFLPHAANWPNGRWIPCGNNDSLDWFGNKDGSGAYVSLSGADYVITKRGSSGRWYSFAFKLSDFGKRLRKIILGCEYQINFADNSGELDALPLFAYFKAYYDTFGLTLLTNFDTTYARKWQTRSEFSNHVGFGEDLRNGDELAWRFINDLGNLWVTVSQDFVSAHIASTAVSPSIDMKSRFIDVKIPTNIEQVDSANGNPDLSVAALNGHSFINGVEHGELDAEYLKRLYRWTNRNTIAGKRIEALLRAQGLGDFCDKCESTFIGYDEVGITISDVVATSDTFNPDTNDGSPLGAYGGRGLAYLRGGKHVYFNREVGYWVSLVAVVPESGYCQAVAKTLEGADKEDEYLPDFDALGYESTRKRNVVGAVDWSADGQNSSPLGGTFGFVPRYTGWKIKNNVLNGDMSLRSTRNSYSPYTLDKLIMLGERKCQEREYDEYIVTGTDRLMNESQLPHASNVWRYPARYAWLGNLSRIFVQSGEMQLNENLFWRYLQTNHTYYEYVLRNMDGFMVHNILKLHCYSHVKPIAESFETDDEGKTNTSMKKA